MSIFLWLLSLIYHLTLPYFIDHGITYLLITSLPGEVGLAEYICTHLFVAVFLAADPDYECPRSSSRRRPHRSQSHWS
jgi:hypothetical protein